MLPYGRSSSALSVSASGDSSNAAPELAVGVEGYKDSGGLLGHFVGKAIR